MRSSLIWVCTVCRDLSVRKLRVVTVLTHSVSLLMYTLNIKTQILSFPCSYTHSMSLFIHSVSLLMYTLNVKTQTLSLPCSYIHTLCPYSFTQSIAHVHSMFRHTHSVFLKCSCSHSVFWDSISFLCSCTHSMSLLLYTLGFLTHAHTQSSCSCTLSVSLLMYTLKSLYPWTHSVSLHVYSCSFIARENT